MHSENGKSEEANARHIEVPHYVVDVQALAD